MAKGNYFHKKIANSPSGIKATRKDDFIATYKWQLVEFGDTPQKVITTIPLHEYYKIGIICIDNEISIAGFIREAIRDNICNVSKYKKRLKKTVKKVKDSNIKKQGSLF